MAELNVEPKNKSPWWIWLLVALIVLGVLFFLVGGNNENENNSVPPNSGSDTTGIRGMATADANWHYLAETSFQIPNDEALRSTKV